jgi:hypothetical protein
MRETGTVYAIQAGSAAGPIKVGWSTDPLSRARGLQTGHYEQLTVVASCPGTIDDERWLQSALAPFRLRGEWFVWNERLALLVGCMRGAKSFKAAQVAMMLVAHIESLASGDGGLFVGDQPDSGGAS